MVPRSHLSPPGSFLLRSSALLLLCGCLSPAALKPVAVQNSENVQALSLNVQGMMGLSDRYLASIGEALIRLRVGKVVGEMTLVVKFVTGIEVDPKATWESLSVNLDSFAGSRKQVQAARLRGAAKADLELLEIVLGWASTTVTEPEAFTPADAWKLLGHLKWLEGRESTEYVTQAVAGLRRYDPTLRYYEDLVAASRKLLAAFRESLERQLHFAENHARTIQAFTESDVDLGKTIHGFFADEEVHATLESIARKSIKNERGRDGVLNFLKDPGSAIPAR